MNRKNGALDNLIDALKVLPNIGSKSAQRIAYQLIQYNKEGVKKLIFALENALKNVKNCKLCNTLCENEYCDICTDLSRNHGKLMIVQMPIDIGMMESANCHDGLYFVLMGQIQPLQNKDIKQSIAVEKLISRVNEGNIEEIIIGTNFTPEGEATAYIIQELFKNFPFNISRLATGMPLGSELEYIDLATIAQSFYDRKLI